MSDESIDLKFLDDVLPEQRQDYFGHIRERIDDVLAAYDAHVLNGYSEEKARNAESDKAKALLAIPPITVKEGDKFYDIVHKMLKEIKKPKEREEILYAIRAKALEVRDTATTGFDYLNKSCDGKLNVNDPKGEESPDLVEICNLPTLRKIIDFYRDAYKVMVDLVREQVQPVGKP